MWAICPFYSFSKSWSAPSHYLNQCWKIVNWTLRNKIQWFFLFEFKHFHSRKCIWKCRLPNGNHLVSASMCLDTLHVSHQERDVSSSTLVFIPHHDVIKWKHFPRNWPFVRGIHRSPVNSQHKGQWRGALKFSLICVWINDWVNNRKAGDLRCYRTHYDVIVMLQIKVTSHGPSNSPTTRFIVKQHIQSTNNESFKVTYWLLILMGLIPPVPDGFLSPWNAEEVENRLDVNRALTLWQHKIVPMYILENVGPRLDAKLFI